MPKGKAITPGFINSFGFDCYDQIDIEFLLRYKKEKHQRPDDKRLEEYRIVIANAFERYVSSKNNTKIVTNTQRVQIFRKIKTLSKQLSNALKDDDKQKILIKRKGLVDTLFECDIGTKSVLYKTFPNTIRPQHLKYKLDYIYLIRHQDDAINLLTHLANIDVDQVVNKGLAGWVDPLLVYLVDEVAGIWTEATGRKALGRTSFDSAALDKRNYMAEYICEVFIQLELEEPSIGTIQDIIDRRKKVKNPVSVTG